MIISSRIFTRITEQQLKARTKAKGEEEEGKPLPEHVARPFKQMVSPFARGFSSILRQCLSEFRPSVVHPVALLGFVFWRMIFQLRFDSELSQVVA